MIECEKCAGYFHSDEIMECEKCGTELCEACYDIHIQRCLFQVARETSDDDSDKLPNECPECGEKLELDVGYEITMLYCEGCDFELDVTQQLRSVNDDLGEPIFYLL